MTDYVDLGGKPFHFIGIGGIGMSALAYILAKRKLPVSGSDIRSSHITENLASLGAHIFREQDASNLEFFLAKSDRTYQALPAAMVGQSSTQVLEEPGQTNQSLVGKKALPQVICSTAINPANLEYRAAQDLGCPIFHRSELLSALIQEYNSIAVAGTHGKTTTSSMIGYLLLKAGLDPTIVVGGEVKAWSGNARLGKSEYLVAEADESDGSLVKLAANVGVITNIELDHPDHYQNLEQVVATFKVFAQSCKTIVACVDCETVRDLLKTDLGGSERSRPTSITYSLNSDEADYRLSDVEYHEGSTTATVWERNQELGRLKLQLLGRHNLSNAIAAVAVGRLLGLEFPVIAQSIASFEGARRRFEARGEVNGISFIDDYAHHPSEISATLAAARLQAKPETRIVAIFQPHRYSRTLAFLPEFAQSFNHADQVIISDIYSAGEPNLGQINGEKLASLIASYHPQVTYLPTLNAIASFLVQTLRPKDRAIFLGAGNLNQIIPEVMASIQEGLGARSKN